MRRLRRLVRRSLVARLVFSFLGISAAMVLAVAALTYSHARKTLRQEVVARLSAVADSKAMQLARWVDVQRVELEYLARLAARHIEPASPRSRALSAAAGSGPHAAVTAFLKRTIERKSDFRELFVLSVPGARVMASTDSTRVGDYRVTDAYFLEGRHRSFIQHVYPSAAPPEGTPTLTISSPMRDMSGQVVAVLAAHLNLNQIDSITADRSGLGRSGETYFTDRFRGFVSSTRFGRPLYPRGIQAQGVIRAATMREDGDASYDDYRGVPVLGVYRWLEDQDLALLVEMERDEAFAPARRLLSAIVLIGVISTILLAAMTCALALRIARPIRAIAQTAERVASGDLYALAPPITRDEVGRLARGFNRMTARLRRMYDRQEEQVVEIKRAATAIAQSKVMLQAIIDNTTAFIIVTDLNSRIIMANRAFAELIGEPIDRILGREATEVVPDLTPTRRTEMVAEVMATGRPVVREEQFTYRGAVRTVWLSRFMLRGERGEPLGVCSVANEITELRKAEEERRRFSEQLQHTQKLESLGVLAGGIAHDFNNLLTAILGHASLVGSELGPESRSAEDVRRIVEAGRRAADLTNQLLAYAGRAKFAIELVDANALVKSMSQLLQVSIPKKVEVVYQLHPGLPAVEADPVQLQQVVMNLITNAAEAMRGQAGTITLRTDLVEDDEGSHVRLSVADTGEGMDQDTVARIFEPFFTTKFTGRGLGLAAVQGIVHGHGGSLVVDSSIGKGTTFTVLLPAASGKAVEVTPQAPPSVENLGSGTVLVVDDEEGVRRIAQRVLELAGYQVLVASDGAEAIEIFKQSSSEIDLVILDLTMPVIGGEQALVAMRAINPEVRVVLSSGYSAQDLSARGEAPEEFFLQKPYRCGELMDVVREAMARLV